LSGQLRILIVDDSSVMRAMIKRAVILSGVEAALFEAGNGREALDLMAEQPMDAVFTDINMPVMSGTEMLHEMSARGMSGVLRVIVSTDGSDVRREEARSLDVQLYVNKPFAPEAIRDVLAHLSATAAR
jgi:two-component system chemotaxis response regulator CheY